MYTETKSQLPFKGKNYMGDFVQDSGNSSAKALEPPQSYTK